MPSGLTGTTKLGDWFYWFSSKPDEPRIIDMDLTTSDFNEAPDMFGRDRDGFARSPCRARDSLDTVRITRREENTDAVQVVCEHHTTDGQAWRQITRVQRFADVLLACDVRGTMSDNQLADAWNICSTMHLALIDENEAMRCRRRFDSGTSRFQMPECEQHLPPPSD